MSTPIFFRYFENIELRLGGVIELFESSRVQYLNCCDWTMIPRQFLTTILSLLYM